MSWEKGMYINNLWSSFAKQTQIAEVVGLLQQICEQTEPSELPA